ncbi:hypothetical protein ZIOFF_032322 [Zingiber officinale]|uniref:Transposase-associated domain-containing protein n=1 Tax=Zingiber officinale TaxID=94328 RepID=A0A8J5GNE5_ZINOF|nr:hypothetical protein ZIOFF_032322 [Zingiber officinale]
MDWPRASLGYRVGILNFLRFAFVDSADEVKKPCACRKCINSSNHDCLTMHEHLTIYDGMKSTSGKASRKSALATDGVKKRHCFFPSTVALREISESTRITWSCLFESCRSNSLCVRSRRTSRADEADATIPTTPMKLNNDNSLHQPCLHATTCKTSLLRLHCSIPCGRKDPCPCCAGIGNASDDIHDIAMAEDELSDDDMQAGEEEAMITK